MSEQYIGVGVDARRSDSHSYYQASCVTRTFCSSSRLCSCLACRFSPRARRSFADATLVLSVGESVEEVSNSQFITDVPTISCSRLADGGIVQVHPNGIRHIKSDGETFKDWQCPGLKKVEHASCNSNQIIIVYEGQAGELTYFEVSAASREATD